ncbi:MAG: FtsQ-type POTRA domain-containing protein [candidate division Zixibacteria bacterium]|nr:FtsQ-type POTRA domain-containing protein [candidate division Zixibacteria bacterium]
MKKITILSLSIVSVCLLMFGLASSSLFEIKELVVSGNHLIPEERILAQLEQFREENLFILDQKKVVSELVKNPLIDRIEIEKHWPGSLIVKLTEKEPVMRLSGRSLGVTKPGEIIPLEAEFDPPLPILVGLRAGKLKPFSRPLVPGLNQALELFRIDQSAANQLWPTIRSLTVTSDDELILTLAGEPTKIYLGRKDYERKLSYLKQILTLEQESISSIDLRFENQAVVKYNPKPKT